MLLFLYTRVSQLKVYTLTTARNFDEELEITLNLIYIRIITSASFDTTFVGKMFMVDCPSL